MAFTSFNFLVFVAVVVAALSLSYAVVSAAFTDVILANRLAIAMAKRESF